MARRRAELAGAWYPGDAAGLTREVERCLGGEGEAVSGVPVAGLAPHAGLAYSGPTAGKVYRALTVARPERVIVLGLHSSPHSRSCLGQREACGS